MRMWKDENLTPICAPKNAGEVKDVIVEVTEWAETEGKDGARILTPKKKKRNISELLRANAESLKVNELAKLLAEIGKMEE